MYSYNLAVIISCSAVLIVLGLLFYLSVREAFFVLCVIEWKIHNWVRVGAIQLNCANPRQVSVAAEEENMKFKREKSKTIRESTSPKRTEGKEENCSREFSTNCSFKSKRKRSSSQEMRPFIKSAKNQKKFKRFNSLN